MTKNQLKKPFFMTIGKTLLKMLPSHAGHCQIKLNGAESFMVWWVPLSMDGDLLRSSDVPKLLGNERFSSRPFQRMSKLSQRIIFDEVTAISS